MQRSELVIPDRRQNFFAKHCASLAQLCDIAKTSLFRKRLVARCFRFSCAAMLRGGYSLMLQINSFAYHKNI
jgi:hypothetical protein